METRGWVATAGTICLRRRYSSFVIRLWLLWRLLPDLRRKAEKLCSRLWWLIGWWRCSWAQLHFNWRILCRSLVVDDVDEEDQDEEQQLCSPSEDGSTEGIVSEWWSLDDGWEPTDWANRFLPLFFTSLLVVHAGQLRYGPFSFLFLESSPFSSRITTFSSSSFLQLYISLGNVVSATNWEKAMKGTHTDLTDIWSLSVYLVFYFFFSSFYIEEWW